MKVKYIGNMSNPLSLISGKIYDCLGTERGLLRVIDESGEDYLYPSSEFAILKEKK